MRLGEPGLPGYECLHFTVFFFSGVRVKRVSNFNSEINKVASANRSLRDAGLFVVLLEAKQSCSNAQIHCSVAALFRWNADQMQGTELLSLQAVDFVTAMLALQWQIGRGLFSPTQTLMSVGER